MHKEIISLLILIVVMVSGACATSHDNKVVIDENEPLKTVYLVSHSWHAGIVIRESDISENTWPQHKDLLPAEYLEVGWGDSDFYQTPDPHVGLTMKAALLPTASVLHVVWFNGNVPAYFPGSDIVEIKVTLAGFERLCRYIEKSYALDDSGNTIILSNGLYGKSRFYQSRETYHLCKTCNSWTAKALEEAGLPISSTLVFSVEELMNRVIQFGKVIQSKSGRL